MSDSLYALVDRLECNHALLVDEWEYLISGRTPKLANDLRSRACALRDERYGKKRAASGKESTEKRCMCGDSLSAAIIAKTTVYIAGSVEAIGL